MAATPIIIIFSLLLLFSKQERENRRLNLPETYETPGQAGRRGKGKPSWGKPAGNTFTCPSDLEHPTLLGQGEAVEGGNMHFIMKKICGRLLSSCDFCDMPCGGSCLYTQLHAHLIFTYPLKENGRKHLPDLKRRRGRQRQQHEGRL